MIKLLPGPCSVGPRTACLFWNDDLQRGVWRSISLSVQRSGNDVLRVCASTRPGVEDECVGANVTAMFKVMRHLFWPCERVQCLKKQKFSGGRSCTVSKRHTRNLILTFFLPARATILHTSSRTRPFSVKGPGSTSSSCCYTCTMHPRLRCTLYSDRHPSNIVRLSLRKMYRPSVRRR